MSILPIVTYNDPVLRKKTESISELTEEISELINNMIETMYNSDGVGLAAPQIGTSLKLFVVDGNQFFNRPGPRLIESLEIFAEIMHPNIFDFKHKGGGWINYND